MSNATAADAAATLGSELINTILSGAPVERIKELLDADAPTWYQYPETGWSALHAAAFQRDPPLIKLLLKHGAVWNAVDSLGNTAADIALSLNDSESYELVRDAGVRTEVLLRILANKAEAEGRSHDNEGADPDTPVVLKSKDDTAAGSNAEFLQSKLIFQTDDRGQEICLVKAGDDEVGVMMGWEAEIMRESVRALCDDHPELETGLRVLNIGHGLGIIDEFLQSISPKPIQHVIVEPHPDVLAHMRSKGWYERKGVQVLEGRWQDFVEDKLLEGGGFDVVYTDTFSEDYEQLYKFFEQVPNLMRSSSSRFGFFHGLGATNAAFYDVYTRVSEIHLEDIGLQVHWSDIPVKLDSRVWGETRKYFSLPLYRMPVMTWPQ
ncbi:arginine methyl transferase [Auriculariales sp. MPI-PUGE-AT-0066]|nr:arginine methyl transferase [Auriculariales sp. MPI-PUGE-AT-0066]